MAFNELESLYHPMTGLLSSDIQIPHILGVKTDGGLVDPEPVAQLSKQTHYWLSKEYGHQCYCGLRNTKKTETI
jgi:hypothetical protein